MTQQLHSIFAQLFSLSPLLLESDVSRVTEHIPQPTTEL